MPKNKFDIISIFPDYLASLNLSLIGKAQTQDLISITVHDLRANTTDVHRTVDDTPYGGGAGMVMLPEPWGLAIDKIAAENSEVIHDLIVLTPAGNKFDQKYASRLAKCEHLIFACGRYEGIDHRVTQFYQSQPNFRVHEISIGDYVLGGGEVATLVIMETVIRLIPGVLGNPDSLAEESHSIEIDSDSGAQSLVEYPSYTKPPTWRGLAVPEVLMSGNHGLIARWRRDKSVERTAELGNQTWA
jgi:tRNA (guanine37-N1)-methyltransferase